METSTGFPPRSKVSAAYFETSKTRENPINMARQLCKAFRNLEERDGSFMVADMDVILEV